MRPIHLNRRRARSVAAAALATLALAPSSAPAASTATELPRAPMSALPGPLPRVALDPLNLQLEYVTQLKGASAKSVPGNVGTTLLDVDGDLKADIKASLTPNALDANEFLLSFTPTVPSRSLPVSVEAVVNDPTSGDVLPRAKVAFGYDARNSDAPDSWSSTITAGSGSGNTELDVETTTSNPGASIRTLGSLFDGTALGRTHVLGGGVNYTPAPASMTLGLTLGTGVGEVRAGAGSPVTADADVEVGQSTSKRITVHVEQMPTSMRLRRDVAAGSVRYSTSSTVPALNVRLKEAGGKTWLLDASGLPTDLGLFSTGTRTIAQVDSGEIGSATVGVATGEPQRLAVGNPYVNVTPASAVARLDHVRQVVVDSAGGVAAEILLTAGTTDPLRVVATPTGKTIDATVSNIPTHLRAAYTPTTGQVFYNGFGTRIDWTRFTLLSSTPLFGRVTQIYSLLQALPSQVTVTFKKTATGSGAGFSASPMVGMIEADLRGPMEALYDDPSPPLQWYEDGAFLRDVPNEQYRAFIRLRNVTGGELSQADGRLKATLRTAPLGTNDYQDIVLRAVLNKPNDAVAANAVIDGTITDLPPTVTVEQTADRVTYTGSRVIPQVTLSGLNLPVGNSGESLHGKVHNVEATLKNLPSTFTVHYGHDVQGLEAPSGSFGDVDFAAWDDGPKPAGGFSYPNQVIVDRYDGALRAWGRAYNVRKVMASDIAGRTAIEAAWAPVAPNHLEFTLHSGKSNDPLDMTAALDPQGWAASIPSSVKLQFASPESGLDATWDASGYTKLYVRLQSYKLLIDNLHAILPAHAQVCLGSKPTMCNPQSPSSFETVPVELPNQFALVTQAPAPISVTGHVCVQHGAKDVYDICHSDDYELWLDSVRLQTARLELGTGHSADPYLGPEDFLKLHLDTDSYGILIRAMTLRLDSQLRLETTSPFRNVSVGTPFTGADQLGNKLLPALDRYHSSQLACDGLSITAKTSVGDLDARGKVIPDSWCA